MEVFDNVSRIVRDDLVETIKPHSRISIAAACFSIYAYQELKKQLSSVDQCRFIFTSPTFVTEKTAKEKREFYIPRLNRERSLYGTEFEVKLRNELTQKAIARECAEWIRKKATFKSNSTQEGMQGFMNVDSDGQPVTYMPINGFTTVDIGCDRGRNVYNMVNKFDAPFSSEYMKLFERMLSEVKESIINAYEIKTNLSRTKLSHLMDEETWMNANKAIELGFADGMLEDSKKAGKTEAYSFSRAAVHNALLNKIAVKEEKTAKPTGRSVDSLMDRLNLLKF